MVYVLGFRLTPTPSPRAGSSYSTSNTRAANSSSLQISLSAKSLALQQTDVPSRPDCATTAHHDRVIETSALTVFPAECVTAIYLQPWALRSSRQAPLPEP